MPLSLALILAGVMRTLVMPFDDLSPEQAHSWIGEGFAEALTAHLQAAGQEVVGFGERDRHLSLRGQ
ncbi:MAG: hypothetical protein ACE5JI_15870 [Acidobacteriota bacterium]